MVSPRAVRPAFDLYGTAETSAPVEAPDRRDVARSNVGAEYAETAFVTDSATDLAAYDRLPAELQRVLNEEANDKVSALQIEGLRRIKTDAEIIAIIRSIK